MPQRLDLGSQVIEAELAGLEGIVKASQATLDIGNLGHCGLQALAILAGHSIHLLIYHFHELPQVLLSKDALLDLVYYQPLKLLAVEIRGLACASTLLEEGAADVVAELAALGVLANQRLAAVPAAGQAAE